MKESVDQYLSTNRAGGSLDSEGSFRISLASARRKLSEFGQRETGAWTLLFARAYRQLECHEIEVETSADHWFLRVRNPRPIPPDFGRRLIKTQLSFQKESSPEQSIVIGLCGISTWPLRQAIWIEDEANYTLVCEGESAISRVRPEGVGLLLYFTKGMAPKFPRQLWSDRLCYSPLNIYYKDSVLNCDGAADYLIDTFSRGQKIWLEYILHRSSSQGLHPNPAGKPILERALDGSETANTAFRFTTGVRWWEEPEPTLPEENVVVFARNGLFGATRFHPVKDGCLLEPFERKGFPQGFEVVFSADSCDTDLSQFQLLQNQGLQKRIKELVPVLSRVVHILYTSIENTRSILKPGRTPLAADVAPGFMGFLAAAAVVSLGFSPAGLLGGGILGGLPAFYFWYSRRQRRLEFERARTSTLAALDNRQAMLREFTKEPLAHG